MSIIKKCNNSRGCQKIGERAFASSALNLILPNSVEEIGYNAFCGVDTIYYNGNLKGSTWGANQVINNNYDYIEVKLNETVLKQLGYNIKYKDDGEYIDQEFFLNIQIKKNGEDVKKLDIPPTYSYKGKDYKIVQIAKEVFCNCKSLKSVTIPDSITFIDYCAFGGCSSLTNLTLPNNITEIKDHTFWECSSLTSITIPNNVIYIGDNAFSYCSSLVNLTIPNSVTLIEEEAFSYCSSLTNLTISDNVIKIEDGAFSCCSSLSNVIMSDSIIQIGERAFDMCESLKSVVIPDSVEKIGYHAFRDVDTIYYNGNAKGSTWGANQVINNNYNYIEVKLNETVLKQLGYDIEYENYGEDNQKKYLRQNGQDITVLDIPATYTYNGKNYKITQIDEGTFYKNPSLISVTIPNSVTNIDNYAFGHCSSLKNIIIPDSVAEIGCNAFEDCSSLTSVTIPNSVTKIGNNAFEHCSSLTDIIIPNSITNIEYYTFSSCKSLRSVTIPDSVTEIGGKAFSLCESLTNVTIPDSVTHIGLLAFCNVQHIEYHGSAMYGSTRKCKYWGAKSMN